MKLLLKFNLVFLLVFAIGFGVAATVGAGCCSATHAKKCSTAPGC